MIIKQISLIISLTCNLDCKYCYEIHKTDHQFMSFERAKSILSFEMKDIKDGDKVAIEFFGGEPFLGWPLIKQVVEYSLKKYPKKVTFLATTNGTCLTAEIKKWLYKYREIFHVSVSIDGIREAHNLNRVYRSTAVGSYDSIDQEFFLNTYDDPCLKMTIAPNAVSMMSAGIIELLKKGFHVEATLAVGNIDWSNNCNLQKILIKELNTLIQFYTEHPEYETVRFLNTPVEAILESNYSKCRYCGAGKRMHCYTGNELNWTPCQGFSSITIGTKSKQFEKYDFENYEEPEDSICKKCRLNAVCARCWGTNYAATGSIHYTKPANCSVNRILIMAGCKILFNRLQNQDHEGNDYKRKMKAIALIMDAINDSEAKFLSDSL